MICHTYWPCFTSNDDDHYRELLREMHVNVFVTTQILIILRDIMSNLTIIWHDDSIDVESIITTLEVQNYHFAPRGNMLGLTFKNYHGVVSL